MIRTIFHRKDFKATLNSGPLLNILEFLRKSKKESQRF